MEKMDDYKIIKHILRENKESTVSKLKLRAKKTIYLLNKGYKSSWINEVIQIIIVLFQLCSFPLNTKFINIWKIKRFSEKICAIVRYFQIVPWFYDNYYLYVIAFYFIVCVIVFIYVLLFISIRKIPKHNSLILVILRHMLSFVCFTSYIPIMSFLLSIFSCDSEGNTFIPSLDWSSDIFIAQSVIGGWTAVLYFILSLFIATTFYTTNLFNLPSVLYKTSSVLDVNILYMKTFLVIIDTFTNNPNISMQLQWVIILVYLLSSFYILISYVKLKPYTNPFISRLILLVILAHAWGNVCLFLSKLFISSNFNSGLNIYFLGMILLIIAIYTLKDNPFKSSNLLKITTNEHQELSRINKISSLILNKTNSRDSNLVLMGYIHLHERNCIDKECPWKEYWINENISNSKENVYLLYQHLDKVYQQAIENYQDSIQLRLSYIWFLLMIFDNKKRAWRELYECQNLDLSTGEEFLLFQYQSYIENHDYLYFNTTADSATVSNLWYNKEYNSFKNNIKLTTSLYIEFWNVLHFSNEDNKDDLWKLNEIGQKITAGLMRLDHEFEGIQKIKYNSREVLVLYCEFLNSITNNKEKSWKYKNWLSQCEQEENDNTFEKDNCQIWNWQNWASSDISQYIIISTQPENFGLVNNISLSLCSKWGLIKSEIIGKNYEMILPDIFAKIHTEMLCTKINTIRRDILKWQNNPTAEGDGKHKEFNNKNIDVFMKTKSKYLIPMRLKVGVITNEYNEIFYIAQLNSQSNDHNSNKSAKKSTKDIYVWINTKFNIQNFSVNAISELGFENNWINSNLCITDFIKEFQELYLAEKDIEDNGLKSLALKAQVQEEFFLKKHTLITWRKNLLQKNNSKNENNQSQFYLMINEQYLNGKLIGYVYKFTPAMIWDMNMTFFYDSHKKWDCNSPKSINIIPNEQVEIDDNFIPTSNSNFRLNIKEMTFMKSQDVSLESNRKTLKELAIEKIHNQRKEGNKKLMTIDSEISEESQWSSSSVEESEDEKDKSNSLSKSGEEIISNNGSEKDRLKSSNRSKERNGRNKVKSTNDEYFKVNFKNIKWSIYDFHSKTAVTKEYEKIGIVEEKLREYLFTKKNEVNGEDDNISSLTFRGERNKENGNDWIRNRRNTNKDFDKTVDTKELTKKEILAKKIDEALLRKESQSTIIHLQMASFLLIMVLIGIGVSYWAIILISYKWYFENYTIIKHSFDLLRTLVMCQYWVFELCLFTDSLYKYRSEETAYYYQQWWYESYNKTNLSINLIETTFTYFDKNISKLLKEENIQMYSINYQYKLTKNYIASFSTAYTDLNSALFFISTLNHAKILPTNDNIFFYIYNGANSIYSSLLDHSQYFIDAWIINTSSYKIIVIIFICGSIIISGIWFYYLGYLYEQVAKKKESYLVVFYEIEKSWIQVILDNCELFYSKLQNDKTQNNTWTNKEETTDWLLGSENSFDESYEHTENAIDNLMNASEKNKKSRSRKKDGNKWSKETIVIKTYIYIPFVFTLAYLMFNSFLYSTNVNVLDLLILTFQRFYELYITYFRFHNLLRNYIGDKDAVMYNLSGQNFIDSIIVTIFSLVSSRKALISEDIDNYPVEFQILYKKMNEQSICEIGEILYYDGKTCDSILSGAASKGWEYLTNAFITEGIYVKNLKLEIEMNYPQFNYNFTTIYTPGFADSIPESGTPEYDWYWAKHPVNIFNSDKLFELNNVFLVFLRNSFNEMIECMQRNLELVFENHRIILISLIIGFMIIHLWWFTVILLPFIHKLNQIIYKTKNMLKIVPKQILCNIPDITVVLNIDDNSNVAQGKEGKEIVL